MKRCLNCMKVYPKILERCPCCGYVEGTAPEQSYQLVPGAMLANRYIIGTVVVVGGFYVVYRAWDTQLDIMVAIKEYYPCFWVSRYSGTKEIYIYNQKHVEDFRKGLAYFLEEAQFRAKFKANQNIENVQDIFIENNTAYCVMEFVEGITFKEFIKSQGGRISEKAAINIIIEVLDALIVIHNKGLLHLDIAPHNVMILNSGGIKVFGLWAPGYSQREKQTIIFTPGFAPPEQYNSEGKQGAYTDTFAVGAMLYRAVTGVMPEEWSERIEKECLIAPRKLNPQISKELEKIILRSMELKPKRRYQSAEEFKKALIKYSEKKGEGHETLPKLYEGI